MTKPVQREFTRPNHNVSVVADGGIPMLRCSYCGDWIKVKEGTVVYRFIKIAAFWSSAHNHNSRGTES